MQTRNCEKIVYQRIWHRLRVPLKNLNDESIFRVDFSVPLMHHDPRDLGLIWFAKKRKIRFRILLDLRIQSWIFLRSAPLVIGVTGPLAHHPIK